MGIRGRRHCRILETTKIGSEYGKGDGKRMTAVETSELNGLVDTDTIANIAATDHVVEKEREIEMDTAVEGSTTGTAHGRAQGPPDHRGTAILTVEGRAQHHLHPK